MELKHYLILQPFNKQLSDQQRNCYHTRTLPLLEKHKVPRRSKPPWAKPWTAWELESDADSAGMPGNATA